MKTNFLSFVLLVSSLFFALHTSAQISTTLPQGHYTFGLNAGLSYQSSDVQTRFNGYGLGLILGKNLYLQENAPFAFDLRGRFLYTRQYGLDGIRTYDIDNNEAINGTRALDYTVFPTNLNEPLGFVFQNHRTDIGELSLEGVITFSQLREKTGVILSLYGAAGLDWYLSRINQADDLGSEYFDLYSEIDNDQGKAGIRSDLRRLLDESYETNGNGFADGGKFKFMPSVGLDIGYQLSPGFSLTLGHRLTFSGTDLLDSRVPDDESNDWYHYTNIGLNWHFMGARSGRKPDITIVAPRQNPFITNQLNALVRARITGVNSAADITCLQNGRSIPFDYANQDFLTSVDLRPGRNEITLVAKNQYGETRRVVMIVSQAEGVILPPDNVRLLPAITLLQPQDAYAETFEPRIVIRAEIKNIKDKGSIQFTDNGKNSRNFSFDTRRNLFTASVDLYTGTNDFSIRASNPDGNDVVNLTINRTGGQIQPPLIRFINPSQPITTVDQQNYSLLVEVLGVAGRGDIELFMNGQRLNFNYSPFNKQLSANLQLQQGNNNLLVRAVNPGGVAEGTAVLRRPGNPGQIGSSPKVRFTQPANNATVKESPTLVRATLQHINAASQIEFRVNNRSVSDFSFSAFSGQFSASVNLQEGRNVLRLKVSNQNGQDEEQLIINYQADKNPPNIQITSPNDNPYVSNEEVITLKASIQHIRSKAQLTFLINNKTTSNFSYSAGSFSARVNLREGSNTLEIRAKNEDGEDKEVQRITYFKQKRPVVSISQPSNNFKVSNPKLPFRATVKYVNNKNDIQLTLNGKTISAFTLKNETVTATLNLRNGSNSIQLKATNNAGQDTKSVSGTYNRPVDAPIITFTAPARPGSSTTKSSYTVKATIQNVSSRNNIEFFHNGQKKRFDFNAGSKTLSANVRLTTGQNTFEVKANNNGGFDQESSSISLKGNLPVITIDNISTPASNPMYPNISSSTMKATVKNVSKKSQIEITVNGTEVEDWTFASKGGKINAVLTFGSGDNLVKIKATNDSGTVEETKLIEL
jgi:hypothetical protein